MDNIKCHILSWDAMTRLAKQTAMKIKESDFVPDVVVAIARGGLVPGRLFCDFLHLKDMVTLKVDHWGLTATRDGMAKLTTKLTGDLSGKNVLLVDDLTDTGESISLAKRHVLEFQPLGVRTATLLHLHGSKYVPDFYGEGMDWAWIVFPWNYMEDMVNLTRKIEHYEGLQAAALVLEMQKRYAVSLKKNDAEEILAQLDYLKKVKK